MITRNHRSSSAVYNPYFVFRKHEKRQRTIKSLAEIAKICFGTILAFGVIYLIMLGLMVALEPYFVKI